MSLKSSEENSNGFTFLWKVKNFCTCPLRGSNHLSSPKFRSEILGDATWQLRLCPKTDEGNVTLNLFRLDKGQTSPLKVYIELFILKENGYQVKRQEVDNFSRKVVLVQPLKQNRAEVFNEENLFLPDGTLTVGCFIRRETEIMLDSAKCIAYSDISTEKFLVTFPFLFSPSRPQSVIFPLISVTEMYPDFKIILKSCDPFHSMEPLCVQIVMTKSSFRVFSVCKFSLQDGEGNVIYLAEDERWFEAGEDEETWGLKNSISDPQVFNRGYTTIFTLHCKFAVTDGTHTSNIERLISPCSSADIIHKSSPECPRSYSFKEKVGNLYTNKRLCDFTIYAGGKEFPVHKTVLGSVSPVFCAMLERDMKEKENSQLIVEDIDADTVQRLIDFAYNETVEDLQWESAVQLFSAADKYEISELKQFCVNYMIPKITLENVIEALMISDLHQDRNLEKAAKSFVFVNSKRLFKSEGWKVFMESNMKIANEVMFEVLTKMCENKIF